MGSTRQLADAAGVELKEPIVTLQTLLTDRTRQYPDKVALVCRHQPPDFLHQTSVSNGSGQPCLRWTYSQLYTAASTLAAELYSRGLRRGMRIAVFLRNGAQYAIALWAAALLGCPFVTINATFASMSDDARHMLGLADARAVLVWDAKMARSLDEANLTEAMIAKLVCNHSEVSDPHGWSSLEEALAPDGKECGMPPAEETRTKDEDLALVVFTSGTTSRPKGVMWTNRNVVSSGLTGAQVLELDTTSRCCNNLPLFHIFGICYIFHFWCAGGFTCLPSATFDPEAALSAIHDEKLTHLPGPPSIVNAMIAHPALANTNTESLQLLSLAAAVVLPEVFRAVGEALRCPRIVCPFGMSEGTPITYHRMADLPIEFGEGEISSGPCCPGGRARICAPNSREILEVGAVGELHIGGPMVVSGYIGKSSDEMYYDDGTQWVVSGDQARMDSAGEVYIIGRYKDLIIRAGENIAPAAIEAVLDSIPGVTSQVVGVTDEVAGEVPVAVIKTTDGADVDRDMMHSVLSEKLDTVFIPAHTITVNDLGMSDFPKTESGKYQKFELRGPVAEFISSNDDTPPSESFDDSTSVEKSLHQIWATLLGISTEKLLVTTKIEDLADSITVMRATNKIKRTLGLRVGAHEIMQHSTIKEQAKLLQSRVQTNAKPHTKPAEETRKGPPKTSDMAHTFGSSQRASDVQTAFAAIAGSLDLTWDEDVEDVLPVWDWGQIMLRGPRAQSWNHRHAFATKQAGSAELKAALEQALSHQAMLRTLAIKTTDSDYLHVIIRSSSRWYKHVITEVEAVDTPEDLPGLLLNDPGLDYAAAPGPLFRAIIAPIRKGNTCGLVYQAHHSCFDGLSIPNLIEDVKEILANGENVAISPRTSYKGFADNFLLHRSSARAQMDCEFHVQRLRGLRDLKDSLWPFQRVPEWFKGNFDDIAQSLPARKPLDGDKSVGVDGVKGDRPLPNIQKIKREHGFSAPAIMKAALVLLNCHYTSSRTAVFTNYEAGREWAFQEPWIADLLPNAMDVNGPTLEAVLNKVTTDPSETCIDLIRRVNEEQTLLTRHAHAPLLEVQRQLDQDGTDLINVMRRQIFNWLPGLQSDMQEHPDSPLKRMQMQSRSDVGILWNCGMIGDQFHVTASFDDAQLRVIEVNEYVERWFKIAEWITEPGNWTCAVGECPGL